MGKQVEERKEAENGSVFILDSGFETPESLLRNLRLTLSEGSMYVSVRMYVYICEYVYVCMLTYVCMFTFVCMFIHMYECATTNSYLQIWPCADVR